MFGTVRKTLMDIENQDALGQLLKSESAKNIIGIDDYDKYDELKVSLSDLILNS